MPDEERDPLMDEKPTGLAGMFLKTIEVTNHNGLAARPAARPVGVAPAPGPRATQTEPEAVPEPVAAPQPSKHESWLLSGLARIDHNGFGRALPAPATNAPAPEGMTEAPPAVQPGAQPGSQHGAVATAVFGIIRKNRWG
jgi:hypothetical protein